jgi:hypothetical protein
VTETIQEPAVRARALQRRDVLEAQRQSDRRFVVGFVASVVALYALIGCGIYVAVDALV